MADFFWFGRIDFRRRVAFVRLLSCFRLGRRVRLGINMVSVKSCGFEAFIPARAGEPLPGRHLASSHTVYPRACGGTPQPVQRTRHAYGLSPALPQIKCYRTSVAQGLLADPATKLESLTDVIREACRNTSVNMICALLMPAIRVIDTRRGSPNSRYVKSFVRALRFGMTAARSSCPKL